MTHPTHDLLERLESLMAKATSGPWQHYDEVFRRQFGNGRVTEIQRSDGKAIVNSGGFDGLPPVTAKKRNANARLMVAAVNALPALTTRIRELEAENIRLKEWRPIETAPKDGSYILAVLGPTDNGHIGHLVGRVFSIRHQGQTPSGYDMGWSLFPGYGGVPDCWLAGWLPLPDTSAISGETGE